MSVLASLGKTADDLNLLGFEESECFRRAMAQMMVNNFAAERFDGVFGILESF